MGLEASFQQTHAFRLYNKAEDCIEGIRKDLGSTLFLEAIVVPILPPACMGYGIVLDAVETYLPFLFRKN